MTNPFINTKEDHSPVIDFWKKEYSSELQDCVSYPVTEQFQHLASLLSPGLSYYYIINMLNLNFEYVSPEIREIVGIAPEEATIQKLLDTALPEEVDTLIKKEAVIKDFYSRFLPAEDLLFYKLVYSYRMKDIAKVERHILHQAVILSVSDKGKAQHVMSIHSDVSHLKIPISDLVSFISLNNKQSYLKIKTESGCFTPPSGNSQDPILSLLLTTREIEIIKLLARGFNARQIGEMLHLSFNTVRTHRNNMLQKTACANTTELVAQCFMEGLIG